MNRNQALSISFEKRECVPGKTHMILKGERECVCGKIKKGMTNGTLDHDLVFCEIKRRK